MKTTSPFKFPILVTAMALSLVSAHAADPFKVVVTAQDGSGLTKSVSGSDLPGLIKDAISSQAAFETFANRQGIGTVDYAGVKNAIIFTQNQSGTESVLSIPITGFKRTFTGTSRDDVRDQIVDFLKKDGSGEYTKFIEAINRKSKLSPVDGNPNAATAKLASSSFGNYAFGGSTKSRGFSTAIVGEVGRFSTGQFKGDVYTLPLSLPYRISSRVGLSVDIPLSYIAVEKAQIFDAGLSLNLPVLIIGDTGMPSTGKNSVAPLNPWAWQVTPTVGGMVSGSKDFGTVAVVGQLGLSSKLTYDFGPFELTMGNHISDLEGLPLSAGDYSVESGVSQVIVKNGLQVVVPIGEHFMVDGYGIYTNFLNDAAVKDYFTVGGEVGFRLSTAYSSYLKLGFYSDFGSDYHSSSIRFGAVFDF